MFVPNASLFAASCSPGNSRCQKQDHEHQQRAFPYNQTASVLQNEQEKKMVPWVLCPMCYAKKKCG